MIGEAIKIAIFRQYQVPAWITSVRCNAQVPDHIKNTGRRYFKDGAVTISTATTRKTPEIAVGIFGKLTHWISTIRRIVELLQDGDITGRRHHENSAVIISATVGSHPVIITIIALHKVTDRIFTPV